MQGVNYCCHSGAAATRLPRPGSRLRLRDSSDPTLTLTGTGMQTDTTLLRRGRCGRIAYPPSWPLRGMRGGRLALSAREEVGHLSSVTTLEGLKVSSVRQLFVRLTAVLVVRGCEGSCE